MAALIPYTCLIGIESPVTARLLELVVHSLRPTWLCKILEGNIISDVDSANVSCLIACPDGIRRYQQAPWFRSLRLVVLLAPEGDSAERGNMGMPRKTRELMCPFHPYDLNTLLEGVGHDR